jgi:uncharacterized protein (TIGR02118 family)
MQAGMAAVYSSAAADGTFRERFSRCRAVAKAWGSAKVATGRANSGDKGSPMVVFSVFYPAKDGGKFDHDYYNATHIPLVKEAFAATGLSGVTVHQGLSAGDGSTAPFVAIAHLAFESPEALRASLTGPRGAEVSGDIPNFTDIAPITQVSAPLG